FTDNVAFNNDVIPHICASRSIISMLLENLQMKDCIITLNGYLGILSERTLTILKQRNCKVYNIHPAPIQMYPELKGLDPQERLYEGMKTGKYTYIGCVIHEVTPELDSGKLVHWKTELAYPDWTKDQLYAKLHNMGTEMWLDFFREEMWK
ncbi:MAG: hypothetical protein NC548_44895, partial [Lachnospiraceae bacterium]|nr:hypothetical protein [Lachnospiraceae bacterium]